MLKLHEAIVAVLTTKKNRTATTQQIADEINSRKLYHKKDGSPVQASQIRLRTTLSKGQYLHLFEFEKPDKVKLKNL
jgi:hypothetical protein